MLRAASGLTFKITCWKQKAVEQISQDVIRKGKQMYWIILIKILNMIYWCGASYWKPAGDYPAQ